MIKELRNFKLGDHFMINGSEKICQLNRIIIKNKIMYFGDARQNAFLTLSDIETVSKNDDIYLIERKKSED